MNTTNNGDRLKVAAQTGDIDLLYTVIQDDPYILDVIDAIPFVETPLHIAASMGYIRFAIEIMNLKPSFAWKLNPQGFCPIHLAMQNNQVQMVYRFVSINKELVCVQGREGLTPLHFASQIGEVELLAHFLLLCPESIEYLTVGRETALHIAVKNQQYEALQVLVGWLERNQRRGAYRQEHKILNQGDEAGNTILHMSAISNEPQTLLLLVKTRIHLKEKNMDNKTALDIASTPEMKSILLSVGAKPGSEVRTPDDPTFADKLRRKTIFSDKVNAYFQRIKRNMTEEQRNTWLIAATLVATAIYQSGLSPPGGIYQVSASDENGVNITSSNSTISIPKNAGKSVLSGYELLLFLLVNMCSFFLSILAICFMLPDGIIGVLVAATVVGLTGSYLFSVWRISPAHANSMILFIVFGLFLLFTGSDIMHAVLMLKPKIARIFNR